MSKHDFLVIAVFLVLVTTVIIKGGVLMTAILTAIILFTGGILVGGIMVESNIKQKLNKGGFVIISNEIYLCKKVMLVDASGGDDDSANNQR